MRLYIVWLGVFAGLGKLVFIYTHSGLILVKMQVHSCLDMILAL
jgi:hypothetical protein